VKDSGCIQVWARAQKLNARNEQHKFIDVYFFGGRSCIYAALQCNYYTDVRISSVLGVFQSKEYKNENLLFKKDIASSLIRF